MSIVKPCPYDINGEHCKYEIYYGEPIFSKCKNCSRTRTIFKRCIEMTNEEMAEESLISYRKEPKWAGKMFMQDENTCYKDGFLAGLKANMLKWHDLRESPKDLPKNGEHVLANNMFTTECVTFKKEPDGNHWRHDRFELCYVVKWCEIPKFDDKE